MPFVGVAAVPLIIAGVTAAASASAAVMQGMAAASAQKAQSQGAQNEAQIYQQEAHTAMEVGVSQEGTQLQKNAQVEGTQQAAISQSGIATTSVSAQNVMRQTAINDALDALNIRYEGQLNAHGYQVGASEARTAAGVFDYNANQQLRSGYLGAGNALLSTGTSYLTGGFGTGSYGAGAWPRPGGLGGP